MPASKRRERRVKLVLVAAFGAITALIAGFQLLAYLEGRDMQRSLALVQRNALQSIALVDRIAADVDRERILVDRHIFESRELDMAQIEQQITAVRDDYEATARAYAPLTTFEGESYAWSRLASDIAVVQQQIEPALALSRQNRDAEAQRAVVALEPRFESIRSESGQLVGINRAAAEHLVERAGRAHQRGLETRLALATTLFVVVVLVGVFVTRAIMSAQRELASTNRELQNRNRELDAFAGRVAHDLRGPLGSIQLSTSVLEETAPHVKGTGTIRRSIDKMARLIEDLLVLSRVESMPSTASRTEPIAASLAEDLGRLVGECGGAVRVDLAPAAVMCSQGLLRQVLWNLGENAVKYRRTDAAPDIAIVGREERERYTIRVTDNGLGMSLEDARRAFEPFYRSRETIAIPGTGLGLAIVRRIVDASGGTIAIDSTPGRGSTFTLTFPLATARA